MMIKSFVKAFLSIALLMGLVATLVLFVVGPASAADRLSREDALALQPAFFDRLHKVLIFDLAPGQIVAVYGVDGSATPTFNEQGVPNGQFAGNVIGPDDGKPAQLFVPLSSVAEGPAARQSRLFLWSGEYGWKLLASVTPVDSFPDTYVYLK